MANHQGVGPRRPIVLEDQLVVLPADVLLLLPLLGHIPVDGVETALPALVLNEGDGIFDPNIRPVARLEPVVEFAVGIPAGDVVAHLPLHSCNIPGIHAGHSIFLIQLPCALQGHASHGGEPIG